MQPVDYNANLAVVFCFENEQVKENKEKSFFAHFNRSSKKDIESLSKKNIEKFHESMVSLNAPRIFLKYKCKFSFNETETFLKF